MRLITTKIPGLIIIEPKVHRDARGFFLETYHAGKYRDGGIPETFVQDNHSRSERGTLRGLHSQRVHPQGKLVRAVEGEVFDVAVDIRRGSPYFGQWVGTILSAESARQIYVPPGFAHGFCVTSESAQIEYKCTNFYDPADELGLLWNDPDIAIRWPIDMPLLSSKDARAPLLKDVVGWLPVFEEAA